MVSIARKNLLKDLPRFLVAQAGITFAVTLVTLQTGILNGFTRSTVLLIEGSKADIWVTSDQMVNFELTEPLNISQLNQAKRVEGVARAEALVLESARWRPPHAKGSPVKIVGFEPDGQLFQPGEIQQGNRKDLLKPYNVMVDESRLSALDIKSVGETAQVEALPANVVALTQESQSIVSSPFLFASLETANTYINANFTSEVNCQAQPDGNLNCQAVYEKTPETQTKAAKAPPLKPLKLTDPITYVLVKAKSGQDIAVLQKRLEAALPGAHAYTTEQMSEQTQTYWKVRTGIGIILGLGASVGIIVGMVVVSQILYSSVSEHLQEFGTLKAMGAPNKLLYGVIVEQSLWMAVLGYIPGMLLCFGVSTWVAAQGVIILITPGAAAGVFGIIVVMCVSSGFLAIQKVTRLDPASVFN
ncbi:MAG: FtsX-like permease family protein [Microcystaceae cyanobacterium]